MTITVIAAPITLAAEECSKFDQQALRKRVAALAKNDPSVVDTATYEAAVVAAKAVVDAQPAAVQAFVDAIETAEDDLETARAGTIPGDFADQAAKDAAVDAAVAALAAARTAQFDAGDAEAVATNTAWYGNGGIPELADITGVDNI